MLQLSHWGLCVNGYCVSVQPTLHNNTWCNLYHCIDLSVGKSQFGYLCEIDNPRGWWQICEHGNLWVAFTFLWAWMQSVECSWEVFEALVMSLHCICNRFVCVFIYSWTYRFIFRPTNLSHPCKHNKIDAPDSRMMLQSDLEKFIAYWHY